MMSDFRGGGGVKQNRTKWDKGGRRESKNRTSDFSGVFAPFFVDFFFVHFFSILFQCDSFINIS